MKAIDIARLIKEIDRENHINDDGSLDELSAKQLIDWIRNELVKILTDMF